MSGCYERRQKSVARRRQAIPSVYRRVYDRAAAGKSLRAAVNSFCLECCGWQKVEVRDCTSLACPLFAVRPYQRDSHTARQGRDLRAGATNVGVKVSEHEKT